MSHKIDWTTFTRYTDIRTNNSSISTTESNPTILNSVTITTPGVYLLLSTFAVRQEGSGYVFFFSKFTSNGGTFIPSASGSKPGYATNTTTAQEELYTMHMSHLINVTANTTVNAVLWQSDTTSARIDWQRTLIAIRVG